MEADPSGSSGIQPKSIQDSEPHDKQHIHSSGLNQLITVHLKCRYLPSLYHNPIGIRSPLVINSSSFDVQSVGDSVGMVQSQGTPSNGNISLEGSLPTGMELLAMIRQQLEYYFSKDNISSDKYLCKFHYQLLLL